MRLITIKTPVGESKHVLDVAFISGIDQLSVQQVQTHFRDKQPVFCELIEIETATPLARKFLDQLTNSESFNRDWIIAVRHPRSLLTSRSASEETNPVVTPALDIYEDLWQFSHITFSLVGRVFLAAALVSYGMIEMNIPVMIAGLLFLPYHHQMLSIAFGTPARAWRLAAQGFLGLLVSTALIIGAGACVASITGGPLKFHEFGTLKSGLLIALVIGVAAALASADDAGRRELIGLAATAHISIVPAWIGIAAVLGFPEKNTLIERVLGFGLNVTVLTVGAAAVFAVLRLQISRRIANKN